MARYMIQTFHDDAHTECERISGSIQQAGAHFVANAEWGCADGNHTAWLILETETERDAWLAVPPALRRTASVTELMRFSFNELMSIGRKASPAMTAA